MSLKKKRKLSQAIDLFGRRKQEDMQSRNKQTEISKPVIPKI